MRILVCIDGSDASLHALQHAIELNTRLREPAQLLLLNVQQPIAHADAFGLTAGMDGPMLDQLGRSELKRATDLMAQQGSGSYSAEIRVGAAAHAIADYADETAVDLIVLGSKGRSNFANVLVGSVAQRLPTLCKRPVLLVPMPG